ncbi:hypothetical protein ACVZHT_36040, partial [Vibrio diabolicus]
HPTCTVDAHALAYSPRFRLARIKIALLEVRVEKRGMNTDCRPQWLKFIILDSDEVAGFRIY